MEPVRRLWVLVVGAVAGVLLVTTSLLMTSLYDVPLLVSYAAATAQCVALPLALRQPWLALVLQLGGLATFAWVQPEAQDLWPLTLPVMVLLIIHVGLIAATRPWRDAVITWWASVFAGILLVLADPRGRPLDEADVSLVLYATTSVLVLFGAIAWRQRDEARRQLAEAYRDVELEQAQRALVEERNRIARELHDVVAHSMSVIHMQATSAAYRIKDLDPESKAEFGRIAAGTRGALREMRQLLALLRDEDADNELRPMPDLKHLGELADSVRRGGVPVELEVADADLPDTVGLAAYRIVQESLSNVVRHAPGAPTRISVTVDDGTLVVVVENGLPTEVPRSIEEAPGASHGLVGMRERARLAGGTLQAGSEALLSPSIIRRLIENFVDTQPTPPTTALNALTDREREVLRHVAMGMSNAEIAQELFIAEQTTKTHVSRILHKLNLRDRVHAVVFGYENGLVTPGRRR